MIKKSKIPIISELTPRGLLVVGLIGLMAVVLIAIIIMVIIMFL